MHTGHGRRTRMRLASFVACIPCIIARCEICRLQTLHDRRCEVGGGPAHHSTPRALLAAAATPSAGGTARTTLTLRPAGHIHLLTGRVLLVPTLKTATAEEAARDCVRPPVDDMFLSSCYRVARPWILDT